ncbi:hypothetical protein D5S17_16830 [Pseudonocardiaceae bacterium YIM PH 21723]|nr:hypothetical protein D5S17_16830 [Pseudonocardiaceae bacterium YIM PH 21723]
MLNGEFVLAVIVCAAATFAVTFTLTAAPGERTIQRPLWLLRTPPRDQPIPSPRRLLLITSSQDWRGDTWYWPGDQVTHDGDRWTATLGSQGQEPGSVAEFWSAWSQDTAQAAPTLDGPITIGSRVRRT